jgi:hypothetical protein
MATIPIYSKKNSEKFTPLVLFQKIFTLKIPLTSVKPDILWKQYQVKIKSDLLTFSKGDFRIQPNMKLGQEYPDLIFPIPKHVVKNNIEQQAT